MLASIAIEANNNNNKVVGNSNGSNKKLSHYTLQWYKQLNFPRTTLTEAIKYSIVLIDATKEDGISSASLRLPGHSRLC